MSRAWCCLGRLPDGRRCGEVLADRRGAHAIVLRDGSAQLGPTRADGAKLILCRRCWEKRAWRGEVVVR